MKSKLGISKQLFIALTIVNLSVTLFSVVLYWVMSFITMRLKKAGLV